jgi:hypothetical protein
MMIQKKRLNRVLRNVLAAMPAIPYIMKSRRRTPIGAYIAAGIAVAIVGAVAAVMALSPRTRHRTLGMAKGTYGGVKERMSHLRHADSPQAVETVEPLADRYPAPTGV